MLTRCHTITTVLWKGLLCKRHQGTKVLNSRLRRGSSCDELSRKSVVTFGGQVWNDREKRGRRSTCCHDHLCEKQVFCIIRIADLSSSKIPVNIYLFMVMLICKLLCMLNYKSHDWEVVQHVLILDDGQNYKKKKSPGCTKGWREMLQLNPTHRFHMWTSPSGVKQMLRHPVTCQWDDNSLHCSTGWNQCHFTLKKTCEK